MPISKVHQLKGLNLRASDINRPQGFASDVQNVELNERREIVKRFGFDKVTENYDGLDAHEYKRGNQLVRLESDKISILDTENKDWVAINNSGTPVEFTAADFDEYNGVLYWTDPDGKNELYKYDGGTFYRAGLPKPVISNSPAGGSTSYRIIFKYRDLKGNIIYSDYTQIDNLSNNPTFVIDQPSNGFYQKYAQIDTTVTINDSGNDTVTVLAGHNYVEGDYILLGDLDQDQSTNNARVIGVTATTIQLDISGLGSETFQLITGKALEQRLQVIIASSSETTFGFKVPVFTNPAIDFALNKVAGSSSFGGSYPNTGSDLESFYDSLIIKGLPPRARYITFYNNLMILANNADSSDTNFKLTQASLESSIYWSDTGVGSTVETFPPFNVEQIGKSSEGEVTGVWASSDYIVTLKERQVYYTNGNLIAGTSRTISALTNGIGCISHKSILGIEGGCIFMSKRGLYLATGKKPIELSDPIEPFFRNTIGLDLTKSKTVNDILNEKLYIYIPDLDTGTTIVYDYLYKEWFKHKGINASKGMAFVNDEFYHMNDSCLHQRSLSYCDAGKAIDAFYKTGWEDVGVPSVVKKFLKFIIISASAMIWSAKISSQFDWDDTQEEGTDQTLEFESPDALETSLDLLQKKSVRVSISNSELNQGMLITGYEIEYEGTQERPKGDD